MRNVLLIVQARINSTRLPGKVMMDISGKPMLLHIINRIKPCKTINKIIIATTKRDEDQAIIELAKNSNIETFSGDENDVLDRYYQAAKAFKGNVIVRVCGDCPLIDYELIDRFVLFYLNNSSKFDYVGMGENSHYPYGLDVEVFSFKALEKAWKEAKLSSEREHVTPYIWKNTNLFRCTFLKSDEDLSNFLWAVDRQEDLNFIRKIYDNLYDTNKIFLTNDVLKLLKENPNLLEINKNSIRREGYYKSINHDKTT